MKKIISKLLIIIIIYISFGMSCNNKINYIYPELNIENIYKFSPKKDFYNINDTVNMEFNIKKEITEKCTLINNIKNGNLYIIDQNLFYIHLNNRDTINRNEFLENATNYIVKFKFIIKKENLENGAFVISKNSMNIKWFIEKDCNTCDREITINHSLNEIKYQ